MFTRQILHIYQMVRTDLQNVGCTYCARSLWPTDEKNRVYGGAMAESMVEQSTAESSRCAARRLAIPCCCRSDSLFKRKSLSAGAPTFVIGWMDGS